MKAQLSKTIHCLPLLAAVAMMLTAHAEEPVKIYILAGQSNMQGKASVEGEASTTLRYMVEHDPKKEFQSLINDKGEWVERGDVWIHYDLYPWGDLRHGPLKPGYGTGDGQIGPELGFGWVIGDATDEQVLLIKVAWGGKSLCHDFSSPSIGKYPKPLLPSDAGYYYHQLLNTVRDVIENIDTFFPDYKGQGVEIAGIGWHQGWNDQYGEGNEANYERNLEAFIKDIRSAEHGLGIPKLPFVIATSGNIEKETPIKDGQRAVADAKKYPDFAGNVATVDTDKPYGPNHMEFKFFEEGKPKSVGYHWNSQAESYMNIGRAMALEMLKLDQPKLPSHLIAHGREEGVQLLWQLGSEKPTSIDILRGGKSIGAKLSPTQTTYLDTSALPGANDYKVLLSLPSGKQELSASCDTSPTELTSYRSAGGAMLNWKARGKYDGFRIKRDGKVIADNLAADARNFEDKEAPAKGKVIYSVEPTTGHATPAESGIHFGPIDAGSALVYEPFDYPTSTEEPLSLLGKSGAVGTKGAYYSTRERPTDLLPLLSARSRNYGALPVTGNCASFDGRGGDCVIELDDSIKKAGLLENGATLWISFVFYNIDGGRGASVSLQSADGKEAIGFIHDRSTNTFVMQGGVEQKHLLTKGVAKDANLFVGKMVWGANGEPDQFLPYHVERDLKLPEKTGRTLDPFNIDQSKLNRLVFKGGRASDVDEIRIGPTYESVIGAGS